MYLQSLISSFTEKNIFTYLIIVYDFYVCRFKSFSKFNQTNMIHKINFKVSSGLHYSYNSALNKQHKGPCLFSIYNLTAPLFLMYF